MGFSVSGMKYIINKLTYSKSELKQFIILNNYKIKWHIISIKHFCGSINDFYVQKQLSFKYVMIDMLLFSQIYQIPLCESLFSQRSELIVR